MCDRARKRVELRGVLREHQGRLCLCRESNLTSNTSHWISDSLPSKVADSSLLGAYVRFKISSLTPKGMLEKEIEGFCRRGFAGGLVIAEEPLENFLQAFLSCECSVLVESLRRRQQLGIPRFPVEKVSF
jgi:hypothetical protein